MHEALKAHGITRCILQIGRGKTPADQSNEGVFLPTEVFRFSPTIEEKMRHAKLIISHAGAGSIMEALSLGRPLCVVTNDELMDGHQSELADALMERGYLVSTTVSHLVQTLNEFKASKSIPYPQRDLDAFPHLVDEVMGFL